MINHRRIVLRSVGTRPIKKYVWNVLYFLRANIVNIIVQTRSIRQRPRESIKV